MRRNHVLLNEMGLYLYVKSHPLQQTELLGNRLIHMSSLDNVRRVFYFL